MNSTTYLHFRDTALGHLYQGQLLDALHCLEGQLNFSEQGVLRDRLLTLREDYRLLLSYYKRGVSDPSRHVQREKLLARAFELSQLLHHRYTMQGSHYRAQIHRLCMGEQEERQRLLEVLSGDYGYEELFNVAWSSYGWSADIEVAATLFLLDDAQPYHRKTAFVGAMMLSLLATFEAARLEWLVSMLIDVVETPLYDRLLLGMVLVVQHSAAPLQLYPALMQRIKALAVSPRYVERMGELQLALVGTMESEHFTLKLLAEIAPKMEQAAKELKASEQPEGVMEVPPGWEQQQFSQTMMEVFEMYVRGVDTSFGAFRQLAKREPFFRHAAHWFGAYEASHPEVAGSPVDGDTLQFVLRSKSGDTDCFGTLKLFEAAQRLSQQTDAEANDDDAALTANQETPKHLPQFVFEVQEESEADTEMTPEEKKAFEAATQKNAHQRMLRGYLHDVYRFFHLFRHRHEGENPFRHSPLLVENVLLAPALKSEKLLLRTAHACYKLEQRAQAIALASRLPETERTLQLIATCQAELKDHEESIATSLRLLRLNNNSEPALRLLSAAYLHTEREEEALVHLLQLEALQPDDLEVAFRTGLTFMRVGLYEEGLERMYKIHYHEPERRQIKVNIGWALLNLRRWDEAEPVLMDLLSDAPTSNDYLNAGHVAWLRGDISMAATLYGEALNAMGQEQATADFFAADLKELRELGLTDEDFALMIDLINAGV